MNNTNTSGPAFPFEYHNQTSRHQPGFFGTGDIAPGASQQFAGMTLRDFFAAKAMQGIMANQDDDWGDHFAIAEIAYSMADAMLQAREA